MSNAAASGIAAAPAFAGLSHNPSFSHKLPVRVPSGAQTVAINDDHGSRPGPTASPSRAPSKSRAAEPDDDRGGQSRGHASEDPVADLLGDDANRMLAAGGRVLDLSTGAARAIGLTGAGVGRVTAEVVS